MRYRGAMLTQEMSLPEVYDTIWDAGNRALTDERLFDDVRPYVAEYIGRLFESADRIALDRDVTTGESQSLTFGQVRFGARHDQRGANGDSSMPDMVRDQPFDLMQAAASTDAIEVVEKHLIDSVYEQYNVPENS